MRALATLSLLATLALLTGCDRRDDLDGRRRPPPGLESPESSYALPTDGKAQVYDLIANRLGTLTFRDGFLLIDAGDPHLAAYRESADDWISGATVDGERAGLVSGRGAAVSIPLGDGAERGPDGELTIHLRARPAAADQLASVYLNERRLGDIRMPDTGWASYRMTAPASALREGENKLRFYFRHRGELAGHDTAAAIGRIAVGPPDRDPPAEPRLSAAMESREGDRLPALTVPEATRLSHITWIPEEAPEIALAVAGAGDLASVRVTGPGGESETLWEGSAAAAWTPVRADLAAYAGDVAQIDLVSEGSVSWGAPQLLAEENDDAGGDGWVADHVVVWVVSGLRPDRAFDAERAPAMAAFADRALRARARSPAPVPGLGQAAILGGEYPASERGLDAAAPLAERFQQAGFTTAVVAGSAAVTAEEGFSRGVELFSNPRGRATATALWEPARELLDAHREGHAFVYVSTTEPDFPYEPSEDGLTAALSGAAVPGDLEAVAWAVRSGRRTHAERHHDHVRALHDGAVRDADRAFAAMLADLDALGVADRTAVILVADYGQELFERGELGERPSLYEEMVSVPLAVRIPGLAGREVEEAEILDVYATALAAAGISASPGVRAQDLASPEAAAMPRPQSLRIPGRSRGLVIGHYKLIVPSSGEPELYDLASDPGETDDLSGNAPMVERYLRGIFGLAQSFDDSWDLRRWGEINNARAAFAADVGG